MMHTAIIFCFIGGIGGIFGSLFGWWDKIVDWGTGKEKMCQAKSQAMPDSGPYRSSAVAVPMYQPFKSIKKPRRTMSDKAKASLFTMAYCLFVSAMVIPIGVYWNAMSSPLAAAVATSAVVLAFGGFLSLLNFLPR
jgi:hypothetical protein